MTDRTVLPDWPRWMTTKMAAAYLSVSENTFRGFGIVPIERGRSVRYDRRSLDLYADRMAGQPLSPEERESASKDVESAFLERRRHRG
jgi:hypothetical protein